MVVGIDLGTTNSLIAVWEANGPRLLPNSLGEYMTPSCVSLDEDGTVLVGRAARDRLQTHPEVSAALFKRLMGSDQLTRLGKNAFRPEELSALLLRSLVQDAETTLGIRVTEAIITVPAYFSDAQRKATRTAGQLAGLKVERLLNEPTAAALTYGIHARNAESRILVIDLGGGTFDVSILDLFEGVMEVRASAGDNHLGGEDFVNALMEEFLVKTQVPQQLRKDQSFMQRLRAQAERAKRALSTMPSASITVHDGARDYSMTLDVASMERVWEPLVSRLRAPIERAMRDARLVPEQLDRILLAGGAIRMPAVRRLVERMFGREPSASLNPDEVVALGAAIQAGLKMQDKALDEVVMTDVAPYSLGIDIGHSLGQGQYSLGHFDPIIERNSIVPISRLKTYHPISDNQTYLEINVYQGEARMVDDNIHLGKVAVDLPRGPRGLCGVDVRFTYDANGLLEVEATTQQTQETSTLRILGNCNILTEVEIAERFEELSKLKIHPRDNMENRALLARADRLYQQLRGAPREQLADQILRFELAMAQQDQRGVRDQMRAVVALLDTYESDIFVPSPDGMD